MDAVFLKLLNMSLTASWIVLAVLVLRLLLQKAPKWINCLLWGVVGLRLIFPFSIESLFSLIPSAEPLPSDLPMTQTPAIDSGFEVIDEVVNPIIYDSFAPTPTNSANPMQIVIAVAAIVWLCGLIGMIVYGAISYLRLRLRVRASICQDGNVYLCDDIDSPFILGVIRPRIYLPSGMTQEQMGYVIGHERAHLRRLDHIWKPVGFVLLCLHWFNPMLWVAYILLCRDIEKACDEKVIRDMDDESKKGYSETLVACSVHRRAVMACPLAFGEVGVKDRIKSVLHYKKPAFWIILVAVVALVVTGVCFLTDPLAKKDPSSEGDESTKNVFTDIDYYEWTGEYNESTFTAAVNEYVSAQMKPVVYSWESCIATVQLAVEYPIGSCSVVDFGLVEDGMESKYPAYAPSDVHIEVQDNIADIGVGMHLSSYNAYERLFYVIEMKDTAGVAHYYYFRVDYTDCWGRDPADGRKAMRRIANRDLKYDHLAYTVMTSFPLPADSPYLSLDLYINANTLYTIGSDGIGITEIGTLKSLPVRLTKQKFDDLFILDNTLGKGPFAEELRENNAVAWEILGSTQSDDSSAMAPLYLLFQKDGTVYCIYRVMLDGQIMVHTVFGYKATETVHLRIRDNSYISWDYSAQPQISLYEFPNTEFTWDGGVSVTNTAGKKHTLFWGAVKIYFADLNQDGYREMVAEARDGDERHFIVVYDIKHETEYVLNTYAFFLRSKNGVLLVNGFDYKNDTFFDESTMKLSETEDGYVLELYAGTELWHQKKGVPQ